MSNVLRSKSLLWMISGIAVMILVAVLLAVFVPTRPVRGVPEEPQILVEKSIGNIRYTAAFDPVQQAVYAEMMYDYFTPEGVQEYMAFNRTFSQELVQSGRDRLHVIVHFSHPLSQEEFEAFVKRYNVRVHSYFIRAVEDDGWRAGIGGEPRGEQLVPQDLLGMTINDIKDKDRNVMEIKGWIEAVVTTDSVNLGLMQHDPDIVLVEVSHMLIYDALTPEALLRAGAFAETVLKMMRDPFEGRMVQITGPDLYWQLEDLGLVPMPIHSSQK